MGPEVVVAIRQRDYWTDAKCISKVGLIGLAEGLDEGVGHTACKHNPDFLPSLHPLPLAHIFEVPCASVSELDHVPGFG